MSQASAPSPARAKASPSARAGASPSSSSRASPSKGTPKASGSAKTSAGSPARRSSVRTAGTPRSGLARTSTSATDKPRPKAALPAAARGVRRKETPPTARKSRVPQSAPPLREKQSRVGRQNRMDSFELSPVVSRGKRVASGKRKQAEDTAGLSQQAQDLLSTILDDSQDAGYASSTSSIERSPRVSKQAPGSVSASGAAAGVAASARRASGVSASPKARTPVRKATSKTTTKVAKSASRAGAQAKAPAKQAKKAVREVDAESAESVYSDGFSYVHEILRLEGELKSKEHQLAGLVQETCRMENLLSKKEENLFELNVELHQAQESILQLENQCGIKREPRGKQEAGSGGRAAGRGAEVRANGIDGTVLLSHDADGGKHAGSKDPISRLEREFQNISSKRSPTITYNATLPEDLYHHVMDLDNELAERERDCNRLREENKEYSRRNKELHHYYKRAVLELRTYKETREEQFLTDKHLLEEKIVAHARKERDLQEQLKLSRGNDRMKTQSIRSMEEKLAAFDRQEKQLKELRLELRQKERSLEQCKREISKQKQIISRKDHSLAKADAVQEAGIPFHLWRDERSQLMVKLKQLADAKERSGRTIERQKLRIHELCDRIDLIASSLYEDPRSITSSRRQELINGTRRFPSRAHSASLGGGGASHDSQPPLMLDESESEVEEAELTDDMLLFEDESLAGSEQSETGGSISMRLYQLLEQEVRKMHEVVAERDAVIAEKDAVIEALEEEISSLARSKVVKSREETEKLREELSHVKTEGKSREKNYRLKLHKLQAKLETNE